MRKRISSTDQANLDKTQENYSKSSATVKNQLKFDETEKGDKPNRHKFPKKNASIEIKNDLREMRC